MVAIGRLSYHSNTEGQIQPCQDVPCRLTIGCGVLQGYILGPILFVVDINDLSQSLLKPSIGMYADDTVIYFSDSSAEIINQVL